jgi:hypothetical protein
VYCPFGRQFELARDYVFEFEYHHEEPKAKAAERAA